MIRQRITFLLALTICLISITSLIATEGTVILMYGVPCAGKSTLSSKIADTLPGNFQVVKRAPITQKLRMDNIEKITGCRPANERELRVSERELAKEHQKNFRAHFREEAVDPTIEQIRRNYHRGRNLIFDICFYHAHQLKKLQDLDPVCILVYCPLRDISRREHVRTAAQNKEIAIHQKRRKDILSGFCALYKPADKTSEAIDYLSKQDLIDFKNNTKGENVDEILSDEIQEITTQFHLDEKDRVGITSKTKPDILIHSGRLTVEESAKLVSRYMQTRTTSKPINPDPA